MRMEARIPLTSRLVTSSILRQTSRHDCRQRGNDRRKSGDTISLRARAIKSTPTRAASPSTAPTPVKRGPRQRRYRKSDQLGRLRRCKRFLRRIRRWWLLLSFRWRCNTGQGRSRSVDIAAIGSEDSALESRDSLGDTELRTPPTERLSTWGLINGDPMQPKLEERGLLVTVADARMSAHSMAQQLIQAMATWGAKTSTAMTSATADEQDETPTHLLGKAAFIPHNFVQSREGRIERH